MLVAIDPGTTQSGWVMMHGCTVLYAAVLDNESCRKWIRYELDRDCAVVVEVMSSYGMPIGEETIETIKWSGRFIEAATGKPRVVGELRRKEIKLHLCGSLRAKDSNIWQAILDRYGGSNAVGTKKKPGPLYGVKSHARQALAVAICWQEKLLEHAAPVLDAG